ncbi:TetR/AcrR family transcriptional regulator [Plastoroseomonas arctica]|uniref:TetR/AcrR family transcriptional regulator n=1 Tax=Plastoroseomonas arctica TaxID=1509237 RepID=A0AAF1JWD1_9PROT|nr:TetR/AcrR family transcriptional regulator [Plastoroseomonas arctica]MBR0654647.1 TetR/AcrR family transcriptional regulator [Plastoroseomonas arctica]
MSEATATKPKAAQRIQSAAKDLFYRQGIRATGVEEVCRVAEATKMSLYRAYPSKDALIAAILRDDAAEWDVWFTEVTADAPTPAGKLRALMVAASHEMEDPEFRGCPMLLAQAEFPDPEHPTHRLVAAFKTHVCDKLVDLAREAGAAEPRRLGELLCMLFDGAWSSLPYLGGKRAGEVLRDGSDIFLRAFLPAG